MSARNLSPKQFVTLYRGLHDTHPDNVNTDGIGIHWSTRRGAAENFSVGVDPFDEHPNDVDSPSTSGVVLRAKVSKEHIIRRRSKEFKPLAQSNEILPYGERREHEVTIRPGSHLDVEAILHHTYSPEKGGAVKKIKRKYKGKA